MLLTQLGIRTCTIQVRRSKKPLQNKARALVWAASALDRMKELKAGSCWESDLLPHHHCLCSRPLGCDHQVKPNDHWATSTRHPSPLRIPYIMSAWKRAARVTPIEAHSPVKIIEPVEHPVTCLAKVVYMLMRSCAACYLLFVQSVRSDQFQILQSYTLILMSPTHMCSCLHTCTYTVLQSQMCVCVCVCVCGGRRGEP